MDGTNVATYRTDCGTCPSINPTCDITYNIIPFDTTCDITYNIVPFDMSCDITYNII